MILHINHNDLAEAVRRIIMIPDGKSPDDRHKVIKLSLDKADRGLIIAVSNPTTYGAVLCPATIERQSKDDPVLVDAARFIRLATTAKDVITLSGSTENLKVTSGGWSLSLNTPVKAAMEPKRDKFTTVFRAPCKAIYHNIRAVTPAAAKKDTKFHLSAMVMELLEDSVYFAASDRICMSAARVPVHDIKGGKGRVLIPHQSADYIAAFLGASADRATIACDANMVWAWNDTGYIVVNQLWGRWPDWRDNLKTEGYSFCEVPRNTLIEAINHAALAIDNESQEGEVSLGIDITIDSNELTAYGESRVHGTSTWTVPVAYDGDDIMFRLKYRSLLTALRAIHSETIRIGAKPGSVAVHLFGDTAHWMIAQITHVEVQD